MQFCSGSGREPIISPNSLRRREESSNCFCRLLARPRARIGGKRAQQERRVNVREVGKVCSERQKGVDCASCRAPCETGGANLALVGEQLEKYSRNSNATDMSFPFPPSASELVLCKYCVRTWKVQLYPNSVERRESRKIAVKKLISGRFSRNTNASDRKVGEIICFICNRLFQRNRRQALWKPHLISKALHAHRNELIAALLGNFKMTRREIVEFFVN